MKCEERKLTAKELPTGDILAPGTAAQFETGGWRSEKPVWNSKTCIQCMICWISCPRFRRQGEGRQDDRF